MTSFADGTPAVLPVPDDVTANLRRAWDELAAPGASYTGAERVAIAAEARRARAGLKPATSLPPAAADAVRRVAAEPWSVRRGWVEQVAGAQLGYERYVEIVGIVSRVVATDTFIEALGLDLVPLPEPFDGAPTGETAPNARLGAGWVPMVGGTSITQALSLVPAENAAVERYHGPMYLTFSEMDDPAITRALTRPQMELVAARTSAINECFY